MDVLDLFVTALMPVLKVLLVIATGLFLATDRINLLGSEARHHLNNLVFYVYFPALIGCSLADTITVETLAAMWFLPVNILITFIIGTILGWVLVKITQAPKHLQGLVIGCCCAGNLGNMLLIILPAICEESSNPFGDSSTCSDNAETYASVSLAMQAIFVWSYVYFIMGISAKHQSTNGNTVIGTAEILPQTYTEPLLSSNDIPSSEGGSNQVGSPQTVYEGKDKVPCFGKIKRFSSAITRRINLKMLFAPTTIAAIFGFIIGIISPLRSILIGDSAPLRVIYSSAYLIGEAGIPSITLIVGANLLKGIRSSGVSRSLLVGIILIKNIVMPIIGIAVVKAAQHFGFVGSSALYEFTLMLQYAIPPAMNIGTISQMLGNGVNEFSVIMLWNYVVASFTLTFWSAFSMWLVT